MLSFLDQFPQVRLERAPNPNAPNANDYETEDCERDGGRIRDTPSEKVKRAGKHEQQPDRSEVAR